MVASVLQPLPAADLHIQHGPRHLDLKRGLLLSVVKSCPRQLAVKLRPLFGGAMRWQHVKCRVLRVML